MIKNALSVQSLACHGKCSLTEALPIISSKGISLSVLPTVLLSTHTGGFGIPERVDTDRFFENTLKHFINQGIMFDGIYTGYFGSAMQIEAFSKELCSLKKDNAIVLVDPVLGDNGKLFSGITEDFSAAMLSLCRSADIITPNLTEAQLLCGEEYRESLTEDDVISLSLKLYALTKAQIVITGVKRGEKIGAAVFNGEKIDFVYAETEPRHFHGTGDIFASMVFANLLNGKDATKAVKDAVSFVSKVIKNTLAENIAERDGLVFEKLI